MQKWFTTDCLSLVVGIFERPVTHVVRPQSTTQTAGKISAEKHISMTLRGNVHRPPRRARLQTSALWNNAIVHGLSGQEGKQQGHRIWAAIVLSTLRQQLCRANTISLVRALGWRDAFFSC